MTGHGNVWSRNVAAVFVGIPLLIGSADAATINIINQDPPGVGLNDQSVVKPIGGNSATTLGGQRMNAVQHAAAIWGNILTSTVPIRIELRFQALPCGLLAQAAPISFARDFVGAPRSQTYYNAALANKLAGMDLEPTMNDIRVMVNLNPACNLNWYYGIDPCALDSQHDFVAVLLHELAHGLGFATFLNPVTGKKYNGFDDAFMLHLEDHRSGKLFPDMTDMERASASVADGSLHWVGDAIKIATPCIAVGRQSGHVFMFAPSSVVPSSSLSHFDSHISPPDNMEPAYTRPFREVGLATRVLQDIGWGPVPSKACNCDVDLLRCIKNVCGSADQKCRRDAKTEKRECKAECKTVKGECKEECKDIKQACLNACPSGKSGRSCRRACRKNGRSCKRVCRQDKRECTTVCRTTKRNCGKSCDTALQDCKTGCEARVLGCL